MALLELRVQLIFPLMIDQAAPTFSMNKPSQQLSAKTVIVFGAIALFQVIQNLLSYRC
nr:hypothetical protein [Bartonella grahamii]